MKILCIIFILANSITGYCQVPPNLLGKSEGGVEKTAEMMKCTLIEKTYSTLGKPIVKFGTDYNFSQGKNSDGTSLLFMLYRFVIDSNCTVCAYGFAHNFDLKPIVKALNKNTDFKKIVGSDKWENQKLNFEVDLIKNEQGDGFYIKYTFLPKNSN
jgi:hypothetical protein